MDILHGTTATNTIGSKDWLELSKDMKISAHIEGQDGVAQLSEPFKHWLFIVPMIEIGRPGSHLP